MAYRAGSSILLGSSMYSLMRTGGEEGIAVSAPPASPPRAGPTQESDGLPAVQQPVVVREGDDHDGAYDDLAINDDRLLLDRVHAENGRLREVDAAAG